MKINQNVKVSDLKNLKARFFKHVRKTKKCWVWIGSRMNGYGFVWLRKKAIKSHRISWALTHGKFPTLCVLHTCDNRACVNPHHLFLGTRADNNRDKMLKGRCNPRRGEAHPMAKLTLKDVEKIRKSYIPRLISQRMLAKIYGVSQPAIGMILRNEHWA